MSCRRDNFDDSTQVVGDRGVEDADEDCKLKVEAEDSGDRSHRWPC